MTPVNALTRERGTEDPVVAGSNPAVGTTLSTIIGRYQFYRLNSHSTNIVKKRARRAPLVLARMYLTRYEG